MASIETQLETARQSLLDITLRNRLINFRPTKARTIKISNDTLSDIYDTLVLKEGALEFLPGSERLELNDDKGEFQENPVDGIENKENGQISFWQPTQDTISGSRNHTDRFLQTFLGSELLQKRLFFIDQEAQSVLDEKGYNVLYLALGFLAWKESPGAIEARRAPLILVPVTLERTKVARPFKVRWTGEEIQTNISLQAKLSEQGIVLPDFEKPEEKEGVERYLESVKGSVSRMSGWHINRDIYLDFFDFAKRSIHDDIDPTAWPEGLSPADHPLIQAVLNPAPHNLPGESFSEEEIDQKLSAHDIYHVMDADPSQIAAIEDAKAGSNLVVEGPPGTGKSQTIVNLIAELLMAGKTVLFVSEKMAALEVVKERLDKVGLGDFCLELHSRKANKKDVLKILERAVYSQPPKTISLDKECNEIENLRTGLNGYAQALREPIGKSRLSPFVLFGKKETVRRHFENANQEMPRLRFSAPGQWQPTQWTEAISCLQNLADVLPLVSPISNHPWRGCRPGIVLPSDEADILALIEKCQTILSDLQTAIERLTTFYAVERPTTHDATLRSISAAKVIAASKPIDRHVLLNTEWNTPSRQAFSLIDKVKEFQSERLKVQERFSTSVLEKPVVPLLTEYRTFAAKPFRLFYSRYRNLRREIRSQYTTTPPGADTILIADMEELAKCQQHRDEIRAADLTAQAYFGSHWHTEESDAQMLLAFAEWIVSFRRQLVERALTDHAVEIVSVGVSQREVDQAVEGVAAAANLFVTARDNLFHRTGVDCEAVFGVAADHIGFAELGARLAVWHSEVSKLQGWTQFISRRDACMKTVAHPIINLVESDRISRENILPCFEGNVADDLLHVAFTERSVLTSFVGELHERNIARFIELDRAIIANNRYRVIRKLHENRPRIYGGASAGSEVGILLSEFQRKRGHMTIRKLMTQVGGLVQKIKPCFMMSPMSIAQFLDPRSSVRFDVILFDEASQVKPEDALGALLRGKQVVVMGDTRQLPPTSFFDRLLDSDGDNADDDSAATVTDMESILHQCRRSFPEKRLRWHYRSKHQSLVAVSNQEFYDNDLLIYPSSIDRADELGLHFVHLPDAVYDRGRSSVNRIEAKAVAEAAIEHYRQHPDKSLGVGTFNIKQQQAIQEEIELQIRLHPEMESYFQRSQPEHFFVKNLETIQGDERDTIFISVGFGFDANRRLSLNFGPLNQDGGWRRLNVLITRAREKSVVFANFQARDLSIDSSASRGLQALKVFLEYAESGTLTSAEQVGEDTDSPFEEAVDAFLRDHDYIVRRQVGCAGFRVDLAIVDSKAPGRYLLGIECDGAKYHSSAVARDRDRLRQQILEGMGWRIHRIWSTDWYRNRTETERRLLAAVEEAKQIRNNPVVTSQQQVAKLGESFSLEEQETETERKEEVVEDILAPQPIPYEACSSLGIPIYNEIHEQSTSILAKAVVSVVNVEGPVHFDEVVRRIRTLWGKKRAADRIREAIERAVTLAEHTRQIRSKDGFLWLAHNQTVEVRQRHNDPPPKIELICDEEIAAAIRMVLKRQFATVRGELIVQSSRLFGFQATSEGTANRISNVMSKLILSGELEELPNGMVHLAESTGKT